MNLKEQALLVISDRFGQVEAFSYEVPGLMRFLRDCGQMGLQPDHLSSAGSIVQSLVGWLIS